MIRYELIALALAVFSLFPHQSISETLRDYETRVSQSGQVLTALAEVEEAEFQLLNTETSSGIKLFGGAAYTMNTEPVSAGASDTIYYNNVNGRLGGRLPILGSHSREQMAIERSRIRLQDRRQSEESIYRENLAALRKGWILLWIEQRRQILLSAYLIGEPEVESVLRHRLEERFLLPGDYQEYLATYDRVRRDRSSSKLLIERARNLVWQASGSKIPEGSLMPPTLPRLLLNNETMLALVEEHHPEITALRERSATLQHVQEHAPLSVVDGNLAVAYAPAQDLPGTNYDSVSIMLNLEIPLNVAEASRSADRAARASSRAADLSAINRRDQLIGELQEALVARETALENCRLALRRLESAAMVVKMARKRLENLPGDEFERYLQLRFAYLNTALDMLNAQSNGLQAHAEILRIAAIPQLADSDTREGVEQLPGSQAAEKLLAPHNFDLQLPDMRIIRVTGGTAFSNQPLSVSTIAPTQRKKTISPSPAVTSNQPEQQERQNPIENRGVYIWNSSPFLNSKSRTDQLMAIQEAGFGRILISLNSQQISAAATNDEELRSLIFAAHLRNIRVELLLGEPSWLLPDHRQDLLRTITTLSDLPFDGLHLDIEQDQLPDAEQRRKEYSENLLDTLIATQSFSPWPIGISLHPRYLDPAGDFSWFGRRLSALDLHEITLMLYTTNMRNALRRIETIADGFPELNFSIAQSIEEILPPEESHFQKGRTHFLNYLAKLDKNIDNRNVRGLLIQSWQEYQKTSP